ncbi:MAG: hemolysin family protein [Sphaerochaetaceae bacterium]|nr:hemolysin family protein [Sphaerochaetaceae bacterium]MDD4396846.1 hemolysin family protein [Sphaerochaetaceae bacterium]
MSFLKSLFGEKGKKSEDPLSRREKEEEIEERKDMIEGVSELDEKIVKEVMVPRIDVQCIASDATYAEVIEIIEAQGFSRYPVFEENIDNIVGILYAKDLIRKDITTGFSVKKVMRTPFFVPDSKHLDDLLRDFRQQKVHIAVAVDEYGGVSGIVCMEDIIEVIVGEIQDEFDADEVENIQKIDEHTYICDARTPIDELNEELSLGIPEEDYETIGGYVFEKFGCIPNMGDRISCDGADFTVESIDGHKINSIKVEIGEPSSEQSVNALH